MGKFGGLALRGVQMFLYFVASGCSAIILGFYSYFLSVLADRHSTIPQWEKAVEGISGVGVIYTILALVFTCCLGGVTFFAFLGIVFDVLFTGGFIAMAILTRDGAHTCDASSVSTPLGSGPPDSGANGFDKSNVTYQVTNGTACRFNRACFAVSIVGAFVFFIAAIFQLALGRHHRREKRYGPSPANGYTSGSAGNRRFWQRRSRRTTFSKDAEAVGAFGTGTALAAGAHHDTRPSHETAYTGSTVTAPGTYAGNKYDPTGPNLATDPVVPSSGPADIRGSHGYHTHPTGTAVNPYGYENTTRTAATNY